MVEAGEGASLAIGDTVAALIAGGGYAQYALAPAGQCLQLPNGSQKAPISQALAQVGSPRRDTTTVNRRAAGHSIARFAS